jgi:hypothetical protein
VIPIGPLLGLQAATVRFSCRIRFLNLQADAALAAELNAASGQSGVLATQAARLDGQLERLTAAATILQQNLNDKRAAEQVRI